MACPATTMAQARATSTTCNPIAIIISGTHRVRHVHIVHLGRGIIVCRCSSCRELWQRQHGGKQCATAGGGGGGAYVSVGASLDLAMQRGGKVPEGGVESQQVRLASQLWTSQWASQREL